MRATSRVFVLALAAAVALAGCGSSSNGGVAAVRQTLHQFVNDLLSGNAAGACSLFTESRLAQVGGESGCKAGLGSVLSSPAAKARLRLEASKLDSLHITVQGNTATVQNPSGAGTATLVYVNGHWRFGAATPGGSSGSATGTTG